MGSKPTRGVVIPAAYLGNDLMDIVVVVVVIILLVYLAQLVLGRR